MMGKATSRVGYSLVVAVLLGELALVPPVQSRVAAPTGQQQTTSQGRVAEIAIDEFTKMLVRDLRER